MRRVNVKTNVHTLACRIVAVILAACGGGGNPNQGDASGGGSSAGTLWALGTAAYRWDGSTWQAETNGLPIMTGSATFTTINDVWVASPDEAWGVSSFTDSGGAKTSIVLTWNGGAWQQQTILSGIGLTSIWGSGAADIWVGGNTDSSSPSGLTVGIFHWDGTAWTQLHSGVDGKLPPLITAWGRAGTEVYFGLLNSILRYDGTSISQDYHYDGDGCDGFWGTSPIAIWTVCNNGITGTNTIKQRQGPNSWVTVPVATNLDTFRAIHGRAANDVWIVGFVSQTPGVLHYDGTAWAPVALPATVTVPLKGIWAAADGVWAAGNAGTILRWNGTAWETIPSGTTETLNKLRGVN